MLNLPKVSYLHPKHLNTSALFSFLLVLFSSHFIFLFFLWFGSLEYFCPFGYFKTEPYISLPLLKALDKAKINADFVFEQTDRHDQSRSFYFDGFLQPSHLFNNDFTRENSNATSKLDNDIRLASLGFVAQNILKDVVVRPFNKFVRFFQLTSNIWDEKSKKWNWLRADKVDLSHCHMKNSQVSHVLIYPQSS